MTCGNERQWLVPDFWQKVELQLQLNLSWLKIDRADADLIIADLIRRFSHIKAELPLDGESPVYMRFAMLMCDAVAAEQHLFAARMGRVPGVFMEWRPPGVAEVDHPFLRAFRGVLNELEQETAAGRRTN